MATFSYDAAVAAVPERIAGAHRRTWQRMAEAGSWWTGAERVAIAAAVRDAADCRVCRERRAAVSPAAVDGLHDSAAGASALDEVAIDAVHRIITDPSRLTQSWVEKMQAAGLSEGQYVELVGQVVAVLSIDEFHRALGLALEPLPVPVAGVPSHYRPTAAKRGEAWVAMIPSNEAGGEESDLWPRGRTGNVIRALSLVPDAVRQLKDLSSAHYIPLEDMANLRFKRGIDRAQMELIAGRVSALNECFY